MKITYNKLIHAIYIKLNERIAYKNSRKITGDIMIDYSEDGKIIGVEILTAYGLGYTIASITRK